MRQAGATALPANKLRGLYPCLTGGKQKLQGRADALGPGGFVVLGTLHAFVVQVASGLPAFAKQDVAKALDVFPGAATCARTGVQPHARTWTRWCGHGD